VREPNGGAPDADRHIQHRQPIGGANDAAPEGG